MKKFYFLLLAFSFFATANAQIVNIPDANFKAKLLAANATNYIAQNLSGANFKIDTNNDGQIQESEALNVSFLGVSGIFNGSNNIADLNGIQKFINLKTLDCSRNKLSSLNVSSLVQLTSLDCLSNQLTSLNVSSTVNLTSLDCRFNKLNSLDLSSLVKLTSLECSHNLIVSLNLNSLVNLTKLYCDNNQLNSIDVISLVKLTQLDCSYNQLTSLNLLSLTNIQTLRCWYNKLTSLNLTGLTNLQTLQCANNLLTSLDLGGLTKLFNLYCDNNQIATLDLSILPSLGGEIGFSNNKLETLFIKNGINNNYLGFSENPTLKYICVDDSELASIQIKVTQYGYTNCQVNSYCSFVPGGTFYTIQGNQKVDSNKNGCDLNDIILPNLKYNITNGTTTGNFISNSTGNYSIPVLAGTHTITPKLENPSYFTVSPTTVNITFPTQSSPFTQNFCIAPNGVRPDLEVTLLPLQPARPGFDAKYKLVYKNKGNTIQSGVVNLTFNDAVLTLVAAIPAVSTGKKNTLTWNFNTLQPFETREITFTMNVNSPMEIPAVNNGDILNFTTAVTSSATDETPLDNSFTFNQTVVGSYDPNDKTCLEGAVITPALIGQYVHYLIRFENTGTFAAENVVIKDMIDLSKFDISTLIPTSASHSYVTKISDGNKVEFIFEKINLPFDDVNNDGYIAFKIKTKPTLVVNDSFTNEANIYFDYNFPILTNKAISTFKTLGTPDFDFASYFTLYPNPAKADLNITTKETINVKSISSYQC
jgi:hypothetical protein